MPRSADAPSRGELTLTIAVMVGVLAAAQLILAL
jgi:hypothetical protein